MFNLDLENNSTAINQFKGDILKGISLEKFTEEENTLFEKAIEGCVDSAIASAESYDYEFEPLGDINNDGDWGSIDEVVNFILFLRNKYPLLEDKIDKVETCFYCLVHDIEKSCFMEFDNALAFPLSEVLEFEKEIAQKERLKAEMKPEDEIEEIEEIEDEIEGMQEAIEEIEKIFWSTDIEVDIPNFLIFNLDYHHLI